MVTIDRQPDSSRPRSVHVSENIENVDSKTLCLVRKTVLKMHQSIRELSSDTGIHRSTVHRIILRDLHLNNCVKELL